MELKEEGLRGCLTYDCFGAGQQVSQNTYCGRNWMDFHETSKQMFEVFMVMQQLYELIWYLREVQTLQEAKALHKKTGSLLGTLENLAQRSPDAIMQIDIDKHWGEVNDLLIRTSEIVRGRKNQELSLPFKYKRNFMGRADLFATDLREANLTGADLRGVCLIAADLRGLELKRTDLIGADMRDADIREADLSGSLFLTQSQVNSAIGDTDTKLPGVILRPAQW